MRAITAVLWVMLSAASAVPFELEVSPREPFAGDPVSLAIRLDCGTGRGRSFNLTREGAAFVITIEEIDCPCGKVCAPVCVPLNLSFRIGPLEAGAYRVRAVYRLRDGCTGEPIREQVREAELKVRPLNQAPLPSFGWKPAYPVAGEKVEFDPQASSDPDGRIVWYGWDWEGDGEVDLVISWTVVEGAGVYAWGLDADGVAEEFTPDLRPPVHIFTSPGFYPVTLMVKDEAGAVAWLTRELMVRPRRETVWAAFEWRVISWTQTEVRILFDASASTAPAGDAVVEYLWDWDSDGEVDLVQGEPISQHTFPLPGPYLVSLTVRTATGQTDRISRVVGVERSAMQGG